MTKNKSLPIVLVSIMLIIAISSSGGVLNVLAQPQQPPQLSSQAEKPELESPAAPLQTDFEVGPATDDFVSDGAVAPQGEPPVYPAPDSGTNSDSWIGSLPHGLQGDSTQAGIQSMVLWDNGPLVTHPGGGYNGNDASVLQTALGLSTYGLSVSKALGYRMAEDFTVPTGSGWEINDITFYPYQTGTYSYPPASTLTGVYLQIWNGSPDNPASSVVYGDLVTNRLVQTYWTHIYRVIDSSLSDRDRPIMAAVVDVNTTLTPGDYWLVWTVTGALGSGPWAPPISILGQTVTGNALQYNGSTSTWGPALDTGLSAQQGFPFVIEGAMGDWLWNQPRSTTNTGAYVDQEFSDYPTYTSYLADDFVVDDIWNIDSIYVPGDGWNGFTSLLNATALNWKIYTDAGGFPAGDPSGVGSPAIWSLSLPPSSPNVTLSNGYSGYLSNTLLDLPTPLKLNAGHYWLVFYPTLNFASFGQFGLHPSDTNNANMAKIVNPGGGFGFGTSWTDWSIIPAPGHDIAFSIGGTAGFSWKSIAPINSVGRSRPAAATVDSKVYLFGGEISGGRAATVEEYNPTTNTWTTQAGLMPYPASNICAAVIGTDVYIPGGYDASIAYLSTLQVYHTTSDTWSTITTDPLPVGLLGAGCAALDGKLYVFGGDSNNVFQNGAFVYDPAVAAGSRWTVLAPMAHARAYLAGVVSNGKIYAIGGREVSIPDINYVEAYDPANGLWHPVTGMQHPRGGVGAYAVGDTIYACGGGWASVLDSCESYNTTMGYEGAWSSHPAALIQGRRTFGFANVGPTLYAVAGYNGGYLISAERWTYESYLPQIMNKPFTKLGFDSQFNGDPSGWGAQTGDWYYDSEKLFTYGLDGLWASASHYQLFANLDYSARMMRLGCSTCSSNLIIRGTVAPLNSLNLWNNEYIFQISGDRHFSVFRISNGVEFPLQTWTFSEAILPLGNWNTLRVFANGSSLYFTINGVLVWTGTDSTFTNGLVGIGMFGSTDTGDELRVDWATLYTDVGTTLMTDAVSPEQQLLNDAANLAGGGDVTGHQVP